MIDQSIHKAEKLKLKIGFFVNPFAGAGGPAGLKGSDAQATKNLVLSRAIEARSPERAIQFLNALECMDAYDFYTVTGSMGCELLHFSKQNNDCIVHLLDLDLPEVSSSETTVSVVEAMLYSSLDLLVFVGGDGTARDVCSRVHLSLPVLGVPSGVKMHSGVFAITPFAAAKVLDDLACGNIVSLVEQEVRDIDEYAFQQGLVRSRHYGDMLVPDEVRYMQSVKQGGVEQNELVLCGIADEIKERIIDDEYREALYIFAGGSTTHFVEKELGYDGTLLGVDVVTQGKLIEKDCSASVLERITSNFEGKIIIILTAMGGQGHILGRGNQQISPLVLRRTGRENLWVVASKTKLEGLNKRPLLMDSNDPELDQQWRGLIPVITGYRDQVLYRLESGND